MYIYSSIYIYIYIYIYMYCLSKIIDHAPKVAFLILKMSFLMKQVQQHNVFI